MKARTFILTAGATLALAVPAANAAIAKNGLYQQARVHAVLAQADNGPLTKQLVLHDNGMWVRVTSAKKAASLATSYVQGSAGRSRSRTRRFPDAEQHAEDASLIQGRCRRAPSPRAGARDPSERQPAPHIARLTGTRRGCVRRQAERSSVAVGSW